MNKNEMVPVSTNYLATEDAYLEAIASEVASYETGGISFMKMNGNDGRYSYGADNTDLDNGTQLALDIQSFKRGYIVWKDSNVVDELMRGLREGNAPTEAEVMALESVVNAEPYETKEDGPKEQITVNFKMIDDPFIEMKFQGNNASKRRALEALLKDWGKGYKQNRGSVAIVEIDLVSFMAKDPDNEKRKFKKFAPKFKIVGWMPEAELIALADGAKTEYEQPAIEEGHETLVEEVAQEEVQVEEVVAPKPAQQARPAPAKPAAARPAVASTPTATPAGQPAAAATPRRSRF